MPVTVPRPRGQDQPPRRPAGHQNPTATTQPELGYVALGQGSGWVGSSLTCWSARVASSVVSSRSRREFSISGRRASAWVVSRVRVTVLLSTLRVHIRYGPYSCGGSPWQWQPGLPQRVRRSPRLPGSGRPRAAISALILARRRSSAADPTRRMVWLVRLSTGGRLARHGSPCRRSCLEGHRRPPTTTAPRHAPTGLPPAAHPGPGLLPRDPRSAGHRLLMGRRSRAL